MMKKIIIIIALISIQKTQCADEKTQCVYKDDNIHQTRSIAQRLLPLHTSPIDFLSPAERLKEISRQTTIILYIHAKHYTWQFPLHAAIQSNNFFAVKALLADNISPNAESLNGYSPLALAITLKNPAIIQALIDAGANVRHFKVRNNPSQSRFDRFDFSDDSPLFVAIQGNEQSIIQILLKAGATLKDTEFDSIVMQNPDHKLIDLIIKAKAIAPSEDAIYKLKNQKQTEWFSHLSPEGKENYNKILSTLGTMR